MSSALLVRRLKEFQFDGIVERRPNLAAVFEYHLRLPQSGSFFQSSRRWVPGLSAGSVTIWSTRTHGFGQSFFDDRYFAEHLPTS